MVVEMTKFSKILFRENGKDQHAIKNSQQYQ